jgi:hypothetical protein
MKTRRIPFIAVVLALSSALSLVILHAAHVLHGIDAKVSNDNNNVDGGTPTPSFDAKNRQGNEPTVAISPVDPNIVASGANDYGMVPVFADAWLGVAVSTDRGTTWFNTMVPGFPSDTSPAGQASPLSGLDGAGDPVVRFDAEGNLYVAGIAFNRAFDAADRPVDNVVFVATYQYTPGTPAGTSTPNAAANPPDFTYAGTTIVARGAVGFAVPHQPFGFAGIFEDKEWMEVDGNAGSPCAGNVYVTHTSFRGLGGTFPIIFSRSTNGGSTFSPGGVLSRGGKEGTFGNQGSDIGIAPDGTIYVVYRTFATSARTTSTVNIVRSSNCGVSWTKPVVVGAIAAPQAPGVAFRTPTFAFVAVDDTDPGLVYVAYQSFSAATGFDIRVQRSTDGGATWGSPVTVNDDGGTRHQLFPTIDVSHGALHVAWYDLRNSVTPANEALDVFYACSNCAGSAYPAFSHNTQLTDVSHDGNCLMFGGGTAAFHGDYIELDARWDGANHIVHVAWADNRDVTPCDVDPAPGPASNSTGNRNQNIYADTLTIAP